MAGSPKPWSREETAALLDGLAQFQEKSKVNKTNFTRRNRADIIEMYGKGGSISSVLQGRSFHSIYMKARKYLAPVSKAKRTTGPQVSTDDADDTSS